MTQPSGGLGPGRPSRTSILVAAARAFGSREPDPSVRNPDGLAERFLGPAELQLIGDHPVAAALEQDYQEARQKMEVAGLSNLLLMRTRFIDEHLQRALENGATQVVVLGAGFDTRAYRFQELLKEKKVFEIDHHSTQEFKKRRVQEALGSVPPNVVFAEIDFTRDTLSDVLRDAGYQPTEKTFFIWEGVCMYLSEGAVRATLGAIATDSAPGSSLVMDFACRTVIDLLEKFPNNPQRKYTVDWGEPWIFGVPDGREREFFLECGLQLREVMTFRTAAKRYLTRADGTRIARGRRVRPARTTPAKMSAAARAGAALKLLWTVLTVVGRALWRRSKWYALAELVVPKRV